MQTSRHSLASRIETISSSRDLSLAMLAFVRSLSRRLRCRLGANPCAFACKRRASSRALNLPPAACNAQFSAAPLRARALQVRYAHPCACGAPALAWACRAAVRPVRFRACLFLVEVAMWFALFNWLFWVCPRWLLVPLLRLRIFVLRWVRPLWFRLPRFLRSWLCQVFAGLVAGALCLLLGLVSKWGVK